MGFYGGEGFSIAKPSLLLSKTTSGNTETFLKGAQHAPEQASAWSPRDKSKSSPSFQFEPGRAET